MNPLLKTKKLPIEYFCISGHIFEFINIFLRNKLIENPLYLHKLYNKLKIMVFVVVCYFGMQAYLFETPANVNAKTIIGTPCRNV